MRDQMAHTMMVDSWEDDSILQELKSPVEAYPLVDRILDQTIQIRWCSVHDRSVSDSRATACLSGGAKPCHIEVRYMFQEGPPPTFLFTDEDVERVRDAIQAKVGIRLDAATIRAGLQQLER